MVLEGVRKALSKFLRSNKEYKESVNEFIKELQKELIKADVNVKLVFQLTKEIKERALKEEPPPGISRKDWLVTIVYEELSKLFGGDKKPEIKPPKKPWVILLVGLQGSGKTTTAAKLAYYYKLDGYRVALVCADTYRPAAYDQLRQLGEKIGVPVYGEPENKNAVEIAKRGVELYKEKDFDIIIVDTAGRHHREEDLLKEMKDIAKEIKPDEVVLVIDAAIGQQAYNIAKKFHESTPIGSIIVTKLDGTAKGGGALSAVAVTGATIKFIGTGEKIDELEVFNPTRFVARILGIGDLEGLLERVKKTKIEFTEKEVKELLSGKINMRLVYKQIISLRRMGPLKKILSMIPGLSLKAPFDIDLSAREAEEKINKWLAIINSMTYEELDNPEIIDRRRMRRIALGAGVDINDVKELMKQYQLVKKLAKQLRRRKDLLEKLRIGI
ncbi:signal recognition particle protein [Desulfurococcaceae archaeon MEX13E-LK6-19]|nr:signal recognition particle protein [Desulfurococcaceae archaeon MEX13E-LK6-19]